MATWAAANGRSAWAKQADIYPVLLTPPTVYFLIYGGFKPFSIG